MRTYIFDDCFKVRAKNDKDCLFCKHCSDVLWDYTNGPYMFFCDKDKKECDLEGTASEHTCELFEENFNNESIVYGE